MTEDEELFPWKKSPVRGCVYAAE